MPASVTPVRAGASTAAPTSAACVQGALPGGLVRTRWFDGMFLCQKDLEGDQRYFRMKRMFTNRALGVGVVWGLRLRRDATGSAPRYVLSPGYALDCCGNDLVVQQQVEVREGDLLVA